MLVVMNELAGRTEADSVAAAVAVLRTACEVEVATCHDEGHLDRLLDTRAGRTVVVVGGDGSLHTTVKHLWRRGEAADAVVGLIPLGTGNDFARGVGIPLDPAGAARVVLDGTPSPIDLIVDNANGVAVNAVHVGAGAQAAAVARLLKPKLRIAAFPIGAVVAGFTALGWPLRVEVDGRLISSGRKRVLMVGLANAPTIAGGTGVLGPRAEPSDGRAEVTVSFATGPFARVGYALALHRGEHPARADVVHLSAREVTVSGTPFQINADGEVTGPFRTRRWKVRPGAWRCVLPAG